MVGIGIVELIVLLVIGMLIVRSPHPGRTAAGWGLALLVLVAIFWGYARARQSRQSQAVAAHTRLALAQLAEMNARAQAGPDMRASMTLSPSVTTPAFASTHGPEWAKLLVLFVLPLAVFGLVRGLRGRYGAGPTVAWLIVGCILLAVAGGLFVAVDRPRPSPPYVASPQTVIVADQGPVEVQRWAAMTDEPLDELWDRLNKPQISLHAEEPQQSSSSEPSVDDSHEHTVAEVAEESADHSHEQDPSHSVIAAEAQQDAEDHGAGEATGDAAMETESALGAAASTDREEPTGEPRRARPDWVVNPPKLVTGEVTRYVVQAGPYATLNECYAQLRDEMRRVVQERIADLVRTATGQASVFAPPLEWMHLSNDYIVRELLTDEFVETTDASVGEMRTAWGLLEFTNAQDQRLLDGWKRYARREGIAMTAAISAVVLSILGGAWALLRIDTWTRGYYTKRLFLGVPAAIIGVILLLAIANS
jgi:hypothetical protein